MENTVIETPSIQTIEWSMMDKRKFYYLNFVNTFAIRCILYPFTVIKTRLQIQRHHSTYKGTLDAYFKIVKYEGIGGLYKGFWVNSIQIFSGVGYITAYEKVRDLLTTHGNITDNRVKGMIGGGCASLVGQTIIIPFDIISQHMMVLGQIIKDKGATKKIVINPLNLDYENKSMSRVAFDITREVYRRDGFKGFYRGYAASLCAYVPNSALWWTLYTFYADSLVKFVPLWTPHLLVQCIAAPLSGVTSTIITNPLDCVRARMQVNRSGTIAFTMKQLWIEDGYRLFLKGLTARLTQSVIFSFCIMLGYETLKRWSVRDEYKNSVKW